MLWIGMIINKAIESATNNPWSATAVLITILFILWGGVKCSRKQYLIHYPFILKFCDKDPYHNEEVNRTKRKFIEGINGLFAEHIFYLEICLKKELVFEEINIRLVKKKYISPKWFTWKFLKPKLWNWENARNEEILCIEEIRSLDTENALSGLLFQMKEDSRGGKNGFYTPSYFCPKGGYLNFKIKLYINPEIDNWNGYISFKHRRGGAYRPCVRGKLTIKNTNLEE
jgi:hypothetical protein